MESCVLVDSLIKKKMGPDRKRKGRCIKRRERERIGRKQKGERDRVRMRGEKL